MARDKERRKPAREGDKRRIPKKKTSILTTESIEWIDYKDVNLLRRFMSERAKIRARRVTGNAQQQQRQVAHAIRIAREMALLPYSVRQVTQRSKGGRATGGSGSRARERESAMRRPAAHRGSADRGRRCDRGHRSARGHHDQVRSTPTPTTPVSVTTDDTE